jgi:hypothetical protein
MALHSKKEFAAICGLKTKNLAVYESRGKLVYTGESIDDGIEPNRSFLKKWTELARAQDRVGQVPEGDLSLENLIQNFVKSGDQGPLSGEAEVVGCMLKQNPVFRAIPLEYAINIYAGNIVALFEFFLEREIRQRNETLSPAEIADLNKFYFEKCKARILQCKTEMENLTDDILEDHKH